PAPLIGSTLTPIVVFLPLIAITGVTGTFFSALAIAMSVSPLTSLVLALVWTSNRSTRLIRRGHRASPRREPDDAAASAGGSSAAMRRLMEAEEASMVTGAFARLLDVYERAMRRSLR